ncbi:hypothetical protein L2E82_16438 [Cichorium intybus]|uniref:Uncharacterized protein n=1 Tax=Cichorium intybus TaxID=13427 RepID=A0ACB9F5K4_CICIN|nr:hypothetical protein L2E82_16438 [Cichorium intybus]
MPVGRCRMGLEPYYIQSVGPCTKRTIKSTSPRLSSFEKPKSRVLSSSSFRARRLRKQRMGHSNIWNSHPKTYGPGSRLCRVCGNSHGLIRKYGLMCCRQCFHSNAKEIGFIKYR